MTTERKTTANNRFKKLRGEVLTLPSLLLLNLVRADRVSASNSAIFLNLQTVSSNCNPTKCTSY